MSFSHKLFASLFLASTACNGASAQINPGVLNPGVLQREYLPPTPNQPQLSPSKPSPTVEQVPASPAFSDDGARVLIKSVIFEGNTKISDHDLQELASSITNREVSFSEIESFTQSVTSFYRSKGFFIAVAVLPRQNISSGQLRIQIIEGYIEQIRIEPQDFKSNPVDGSLKLERLSGPLERWLLSYLQPVVGKGTAPLSIHQLERQLLLAEAAGGVQLSSVLSPGVDLGSSILTLRIIPNRLQTSLAADNWVPTQLGDFRATVNAFDTPFISLPIGMTALASYTWPVSNGLSSVFYSASLPLGTSGLTTSGSISYTKTNSSPLASGLSGVTLTTDGQSSFGSLAFRYPFKLSRLSSLYGSAQLDLLNSTNSTLAASSALSSTTSNLRTLRLRLEANAVSRRWSTLASLQLSQGLPIYGSENTTQLVGISSESSYGKLDFTTVQVNLAYQHSIASNNELQLSLRAMGQLAKGPTPSAEQIGYGGSTYGRGYRSITILGDQGVMGSFELSYNLSDVIKGLYLQPYAFLDAGIVSLKQSEFFVSSSQSVVTAGMGLRIFSLRSGWLSADAGYGVPFSSDTTAAATGFTNGNGYFRITLNF